MAFKIALGLPRWASIDMTYKEAGVLPSDGNRKLFSCKYTIRARAVSNSVVSELDEKTYISREIRNKTVYTSLSDYVSPLLQKCNISHENIAKIPGFTYPWWLTNPAEIVFSYGDLTKNDNPLLIASKALELISTKYKSFLRIFTDGSATDSSEVGSAFVIPDFDIKKRFHLTKGCSIFTAELFAILMALNFCNDMVSIPSRVLILSDSKSALMALYHQSMSSRPDIVSEILFQIHQLIMRGCNISLLWVPGHSNLYGNELADLCAKEAATKELNTTVCDIPISVSEACNIVSHAVWNDRQKHCLEDIDSRDRWDLVISANHHCNPPGSIPVRNLIHRLRINAWLGRFLDPRPICFCGHLLDIPHLLFECAATQDHFKSLHEKILSFNKPLTMSSVFNPCKVNGWTLTLAAVHLIRNHPLGRLF